MRDALRRRRLLAAKASRLRSRDSKKFQKAYVLNAAGLIKAQQHEMLGEPCFLDGSSDIVPVMH